MSVGIIAICEINDGNGWKALPDMEGVKELTLHAGSNEYAVLAGVRDRFGVQLFEPNGLPNDISSAHFRWKSERKCIMEAYESNKTTSIVFPAESGRKPIRLYDIYKDDYAKQCIVEVSKEEYESLSEKGTDTRRQHCHVYYPEQYLIFDASVIGGRIEELSYKAYYPTFEEYARAEANDQWSDEMQDWGRWDVNFDCEEVYAASHRTLAELETADYSKATGVVYKMDRIFYEAFVDAGGVLPDIFHVEEEASSSDFLTALQDVFMPTVSVWWASSEAEKAQKPLMKMLDELKAVADKYGVEHNCVRIVFAFL